MQCYLGPLPEEQDGQSLESMAKELHWARSSAADPSCLKLSLALSSVTCVPWKIQGLDVWFIADHQVLLLQP